MTTLLRKTLADSLAPCLMFAAFGLACAAGWLWLALPTLFAGCYLTGEALYRITHEED